MSRRTLAETIGIHLFWACLCGGMLTYLAQPFSMKELGTVASEISVEAISFGPFECKCPSARCASVLFFALAALMTLPGIVQTVQWATSMFSRLGKHVQTTANLPTSQEVNTAQATQVYTEQKTQLKVDVHMPQAKAELAHDGVYKVFRAGAQNAYTVVMHATAEKLVNAADGLTSALDEEDHATRYRKSKLDKLMDFLTKLWEIQGEPWITAAVTLYGGAFTQKAQLVESTHAKLEAVRTKIAVLHLDFEKARKTDLTQVAADEFEARFAELYREASDVLKEFKKELGSLNKRCNAEKDPSHVLGNLSDQGTNAIQRS